MSAEPVSAIPQSYAIHSKGKFHGHIEGISVYSEFIYRHTMLRCGLHGLPQAGICGDPIKGAYSICLSGGYEDDIDDGDRITYVGSGGQLNKKQVTSQSFDSRPNSALLTSYHTQRPVRVIRGKCSGNVYAPVDGYRYDGLYLVDNAEMRKGKSGLDMCTYTLSRIQEPGVGPIPLRCLSLREGRRHLLKDIASSIAASETRGHSHAEQNGKMPTVSNREMDPETTGLGSSDEIVSSSQKHPHLMMRPWKMRPKYSSDSESDTATGDKMDTDTTDSESSDEIDMGNEVERPTEKQVMSDDEHPDVYISDYY